MSVPQRLSHTGALSAEDVQATYALRWQIELLFKELKSHYRPEDMPSRKHGIVESLL